MRFKTDENLPVEVARLFTSHGHDAKTVEEQGLGGTTDPEVAAACGSEGRILVTLDTDFSDIRQYPPGSHPGIIVFRISRQDKVSILGVTRRLLQALTNLDPTGVLWIVDNRRIRVREA
jgi:predicted nuclease of predicted toxin-antitoxin system